MAKDRTTPNEFRVGVLGAGMIASHPGGVLPNLAPLGTRVKVVAITSRTRTRAEEVAARFGIPRVRETLTEMLSEDDLDVVVNLTPGPAHSETNLEILESDTHLISEKPLATTIADADALIEIADKRRLLIVAAPPWMLDPRRAAVRDLIQQGAIGRVAFARSRSSHAGPAAMSWPADPTWAYAEGAGALPEMGVYGITEVTGILGPAKRVMAMSGITEQTRVAVGGLFDGRTIEVTADDNTLLLLDFGGATFAVVDATYNVAAASSPSLEVFGSQGTLNLYDPFWAKRDQPQIELFQPDQSPGHGGWTTPDLTGLETAQAEFDRLQRAILLSHFVDCVDTGMKPVLSAQHARHTLEIMLGAQVSARTGCAVELETSFDFSNTALDEDRTATKTVNLGT
jgi:predicted dehydrogenase